MEFPNFLWYVYHVRVAKDETRIRLVSKMAALPVAIDNKNNDRKVQSIVLTRSTQQQTASGQTAQKLPRTPRRRARLPSADGVQTIIQQIVAAR